MNNEDKITFLAEQQSALESINILCSLIKKANPSQIITPLIFNSIFRNIHAAGINDPNFEADDKFVKFFN